jgi:hypothetical protein
MASAERKGRLWPWFVAGFALVFVSLLFIGTMYTWTPDARGLMGVPPWRYYLIDLPHLFKPEMVGPASGRGETALMKLMWHSLFSAVGGALLMGLAWGVREVLRSRREKA